MIRNSLRILPFAAIGVFLSLWLADTASAQVQVDISFKRTLYIVYEPIMMTVTINNLTGGELQLTDTPAQKWFSVQLETTDGRPIPPVNPDYNNPPVQIGPGQKLTRSINLTPLFPLGEFGTYRVRAAVYIPELKRYFSSPTLNIELTEGRLLWQKTVGVPQGAEGSTGGTRVISILAHRLPSTSMLYIRIEDKEAGVVYCTHQLGRFVSFGEPNVLLDRENQIHILQNVAPKAFVYSHIGLNGEVIERKSYSEMGTRPNMRRVSDGTITIVGGTETDTKASAAEAPMPALHHRPVPLPSPQTKATAKPKKDDETPENLLSR